MWDWEQFSIPETKRSLVFLDVHYTDSKTTKNEFSEIDGVKGPSLLA